MVMVKPEIQCEQAVGHMMRREFADAAVLLESALLKEPKYADAWANRGLCMIQLGHPFDAILHFEKAIALRPTSNPEFWNNLGVAYFNLELAEKAITAYKKCLELRDDDNAYLNMGNALKFMGDIKGAIEAYRGSVRAKPDNANSHLLLSAALLQNGEFEEGWKEFEWRWKTDQLPPRGLTLPEWNGESLEGKTLLIYPEQGFGDYLQFIRYVKPIKERFGGRIIVEVRQQMARLAKTVPGVDEVHVFGDKLPLNIDYCIPCMSVARIMGTTVDTIPWYGPYFEIDQTRVNMWHQVIDTSPLPKGIKIGICWAGMSRPGRPEADAIDKKRSTTLASFAPLALVPDISWVSLQKGPADEQLTHPPQGMTIGHWMDQSDDWYDTAALIKCLDLVISVDTAVVHVAAALGKPTWLLSRYDGCWRWMGHKAHSPWYPSLRQFWQRKPNDWGVMMEEVALALHEFRDNIVKQVA